MEEVKNVSHSPMQLFVQLMSGLSSWLWATSPDPFKDLGSIPMKGRKPTNQVKGKAFIIYD